jgi:hypothetical protein
MIPGSANPLLLKSAAAGGAAGDRSLRFNSVDSAHLSRTPGTAGNRRTWTWSGWVKRSKLGVDEAFFEAKPAAGGWFALTFDSSNRINIGHLYGISYNWATNAVFRDLSAWYHIVAVCDTTSATNTITGTATDRLRLYVNGTQQSLGVFGSPPPASPPAQNADLQINDTVPHYIGRYSATTSYSNFYLANIHFIDGQALTPSSFTETDATTGQLIPKTYTGSYGTNGFNLLFADNSSNTASTLGKDTSGLSNNWTPNNLSVTAGAGNDSLVDFPVNGGTDTGVGGTVRGNYCTFNPLNSTATLTNGNLDASASATYSDGSGSIGFATGKWYAEFTCNTLTTQAIIGVTKNSLSGLDGSSDGFRLAYLATGTIAREGTGTPVTGVASYGAGDVIGVAIDCDGGNIYFYKNNTLINTTTNATISSNEWRFFTRLSSASVSANFGQRQFAYTSPAGFKALNTANLPAPLVTKSSTVFDTKLYTGNGSSQSISTDFSPDFVWIKDRSAVDSHRLHDIIRNSTALYSNTTDAETTQFAQITAWNSTGFTVGPGSNSAVNGGNTSGRSYVAWTWDAGSSTVTNTQGSITSSVRANATAGFSIVTWTGDGSGSETIGHGLGVAPAFIIVKDRSLSRQWNVYHASIGATNGLVLNLTSAVGGSSDAGFWNNTSPTSTVFTVGTYENEASNYVAYCFAPVVGSSSFGSYVGNGSADGPFVYTGFRPRFILVKNTSVSGAWEIYDSARNSYNVMSLTLLPNASDAEINAGSGVRIDFLSNGFKWRDVGGSINGSGNTMIYAAFAESPFNYARAR